MWLEWAKYQKVFEETSTRRQEVWCERRAVIVLLTGNTAVIYERDWS